MFKGVRPILYAGREVLPLIEGGKGVSATNHLSSGAWAAAGGIGTVSAVNADSYDPEGRIIPQIYHALTRRDRHEELINYAIDGAVVFEVRDAFCPWNEGRWRLEGGSAQRTDDAADIALDVRELGSVYLGGFTFAELAVAGRVEELRDGALARADDLFRTDVHPWCPEIF